MQSRRQLERLIKSLFSIQLCPKVLEREGFACLHKFVPILASIKSNKKQSTRGPSERALVALFVRSALRLLQKDRGQLQARERY
jgi:hypothetical protein